MRAAHQPPVCVTRSHARHLYWTFGQLIAHHASNGCNLRSGDLLASGTVSGPEPESRACLLERTWRGTEPLTLPSGEQRRFLEDGDEVLMRGRAARAGRTTIGFGECRAQDCPRQRRRADTFLAPSAGAVAGTCRLGDERVVMTRCGFCGSSFVRAVRPRWWQWPRVRWTRRLPHECWHCGWVGWMSPDRRQGQVPSLHPLSTAPTTRIDPQPTRPRARTPGKPSSAA